jgi:NADPH2:quinone reductase
MKPLIKVRLDAAGSPDAMRLEPVQVQAPGPGQVWLEQTAIGVNPLDVSQRKGAVAIPFPSGLGLEGAGRVAAVGEGVANVAVGDRVGYATGPLGAYAGARLYPAERLVKLPDALSDEDAAAVLFKGITAQYLLKTTHAVGPGSRIVIYGAASGLPDPVSVATLNAKGSLFLTRPSLAAHTATAAEYQERAQDVLAAVAAGIIVPRVWRRHALAEVAQAHGDLEQGRSQGAIILTP